MKSKIKLITKKCEYLTEIIKFKDLNCNFQQNSDDLKKKGNIIILGNFDGVHKGHMTIFQNAITRAKEKDYNTVVYTFREYPQKKSTKITTPSEKVELIDEAGIDYIYLDEFEDVRNYSPEEFVEKVLVNTLNVKEIYCGFNFTFGKNKSGNIKVLDDIIRDKYNNSILINVQSPVLDSENDIISSTRIREYIEKTDFKKITELLGHNFIIIGEVIHGKKLGRTLGFPTANLEFDNKVYPDFGVYGVYVHVEGDSKIYHGVMSIGENPTIKGHGLSVETHIFDFNRDIYGKIVMVEVLEKISNQIKLNSIDELIEKINVDAIIWKKRIEEKYHDTSKNR